MKRIQFLETILVLAGACIVFYLLYPVLWLLILGLSLLFIGLFIKRLAQLISCIWLWLARKMGFVMSKILLSLVFFVIVFPTGWLYRMFGNDRLTIKRKGQLSLFLERNHEYTSKDLENIW